MLVKIDQSSDAALLQAALKNMSTDGQPAENGSQNPEIRTPDSEEPPARAAPLDPNDAELCREEIRLATFERDGSAWPANAKMEPRKIAKAGLFYTGQYQETKCPWCSIVVTQWDYGDQAIVKHRALSPDCPFVLGTSNNVPLLRMTPSPTPSPALSRSTSTPRDIPDGPAPPPPEPHQPPIPVNIESREFLSEANRFKTFSGRWPLDFIRPADLANAGFIYTGRDDIVQCVFCREFIGRWNREDFPHTEHRSIFPTCPFVLGQECGNIPIQTQPYDPFVSQDMALPHQDQAAPGGSGASAGVDEAGCKEDDRGMPVDEGSQKESVITLINPGEATGIIEHTGPAAPKYNTVESRVRTFQNWPPDLRQRPIDMAEAGFYHIVSRGGGGASSTPDKVKCYYCDGGLMNWQPEDDPWTEHARWFHLCAFLRLVKGDEFIREVLLKHPRQPVPELPGAEIMPETVELSVKEDQLRNMMSSMLVNQVLEMGVAYATVQAALEKKLRTSGCGYKSAGELFDAAIKERSSSTASKPNPTTTSKAPTAPTAAASSSSLPAAAADETPSTSRPGPSRVPERAELPAPQPAPAEPEKAELAGPPAEAENMDIEEPKNPKQLEDEMQRLRDQRLCKVCFVNESNVAFLPCGHLICCAHCVPSLKDCPYCRQPITGTLKTYMS